MLLTLKIATSLDGRIALANGKSRWITGQTARKAAHKLRSQHDAVLIGSGTALADDPLLTARNNPDKQPVRLVLDTHLRQSAQARLCCSTQQGRVIFACGNKACTHKTELFQKHGVEIWSLPEYSHGGLRLDALLDKLQADGLSSLLIEGGSKIAASFLRYHPPARMEWFRAPVLTGSEGLPAVGALGLTEINDMPRYRRTSLQVLGDDILESLERQNT